MKKIRMLLSTLAMVVALGAWAFAGSSVIDVKACKVEIQKIEIAKAGPALGLAAIVQKAIYKGGTGGGIAYQKMEVEASPLFAAMSGMNVESNHAITAQANAGTERGGVAFVAPEIVLQT